MAMELHDPVPELQPQFSSAGATPTPWAVACEHLERAEVFWLATVRPDGRPHVAPLLAVWLDGALHLATGPGGRKARNLASNARCVLTTGCNALNEGLDLVIEGVATLIGDEERLRRVAERFAAKYGWHYTVADGALYGDGDRTTVYAVPPVTGFGFGKGEPFSQTRWRFSEVRSMEAGEGRP